MFLRKVCNKMAFRLSVQKTSTLIQSVKRVYFYSNLDGAHPEACAILSICF